MHSREQKVYQGTPYWAQQGPSKGLCDFRESVSQFLPFYKIHSLKILQTLSKIFLFVVVYYQGLGDPH